MSLTQIDYYFPSQFYDLQSPPGLLNKKCGPTIDSHTADNAFLMFFFSIQILFKSNEFQKTSRGMSS